MIAGEVNLSHFLACILIATSINFKREISGGGNTCICMCMYGEERHQGEKL
jgi:hypothetical protein